MGKITLNDVISQLIEVQRNAFTQLREFQDKIDKLGVGDQYFEENVESLDEMEDIDPYAKEVEEKIEVKTVVENDRTEEVKSENNTKVGTLGSIKYFKMLVKQINDLNIELFKKPKWNKEQYEKVLEKVKASQKSANEYINKNKTLKAKLENEKKAIKTTAA